MGHQIERKAFGIKPTRVLPARSHQNVCPGFTDSRDAVRLQISAVRDADLVLDHWYPVKRFTLFLICQFEVTKALIWQIKCTMNAPKLTVPARSRSCLRHCRRIDDADQAAPARLRGCRSEQALHQHCKPIATLTQAIEQRHAAEVGKANRSGPRGCRSQPSFTQTIGQHQPK